MFEKQKLRGGSALPDLVVRLHVTRCGGLVATIGYASWLLIAVPREWDVWVFACSAAACTVYLGFVMPSFLMR